MLDKRVSYYTRKVAEYGSVHISKGRKKSRAKRLEVYKEELNRRLREGER